MAFRSSAQAQAVRTAAAEPPIDEQALVARVRAGDRTAFDDLMREYYRPLRTYLAGHVESAAVAEEMLQDLFLWLWRHREQWEVRRSVRAYLYTATRNAVLLHRRHRRVVERWEANALHNGEAPGMSEPPRALDAQVQMAEVTNAVQRALRQLPDRCRQAAELRLQHQLSYTETAEVMGITVKAVERLYTRALKSLREALVSYW